MKELIQIDARDLLCPLPVLRLRKALGKVAPGSRVQLLATDPASQVDVPHFCTEQGHHLIRQAEGADGHFIFTIAKAP